MPHAARRGTNHANVYVCCFLHSSCTPGYKQSSVQSPASSRGELIAEGRGEHSARQSLLSWRPSSPEIHTAWETETDLKRLEIDFFFHLHNYIRIRLQLRCMALVIRITLKTILKIVMPRCVGRCYCLSLLYQ